MAKIGELTVAVRTILVEGGCKLIAEERDEQINKHGFTKAGDLTYEYDELVRAAVSYALPPDHIRKLDGQVPQDWPWDNFSFKENDGTIDGRIKELVKAGALIAAEIDRLLAIKDEQKKKQRMEPEPRKDPCWTCKVGAFGEIQLPLGSDSPMRNAVAEAYKQVTGIYPTFCFSGWGENLTEYERAIVEEKPL